MPFLEHFGLTDYPFGLTPNPKLYYASPETEALLAALVFAITRGDGLLKITGEVGTGKTLLCRMLLEKLAEHDVNTAYLNAPVALTSAQLPAQICKEFGVAVGKKDPVNALRDFLVKEHSKGKRNVLIIDEAQALGAEGLETVRLLSNLETNTDKLLQMVLFGQAELDLLLQRQDLRQLLQRVNFKFDTKPFQPDAVSTYLKFRLDACAKKVGKGKKKTPQTFVTFTPRASMLLTRVSGGLPRLIHVLADKAMLAAYTQGALIIDVRHVRRACRETDGLVFPWGLLVRVGF